MAFCRTCIDNKINLISIFEIDCDNLKIADKIMFCLSIKIHDKEEKLSSLICTVCLSKLKLFYEFKLKCEQNEQMLKSKFGFEHERFKEECTIEEVSVDKSYEIEKLENNKNEKRELIDYVKQTHLTNTKKTKLSKLSKEKKPELKTKRNYNISTQCSTCGKIISSKFRLKCHMLIHSGEKPFVCQQCGRRFTLAHNLKVHERIHTGERPISCSTCGKKFAQPSGLIAHARIHSGELPYKCTFCPLAFKTGSHLKYHINLHTNEKKYICDICDRAFIAKSDLSQHYKIHSQQRNHICSVCGLRLLRHYHLQRHMLTHETIREKKFKCDLCNCSYTQKGDLVRHKKKHSNISKETANYQDSISLIKNELINNIKIENVI